MKKLFLIFSIFILCLSCKRKFTCEITSTDMTSGIVIGKESHLIKEKSKSNALETCKMQYGASIPETIKTFEIK